MLKILIKTTAYFLCIALLCTLPVSLNKVSAASWKQQRYEHFSKDEDLVDLLMDFSSSIGIPVSISERFKEGSAERVNGHFKNITAEGFLSRLSSIYQVIWYFDGHILYIYHSDEMLTELFQLEGARARNLRKTLISLGVLDSRFNWKMIEEQSIIYISGPPRYIDLVKDVATLLEQQHKKESIYTVRTFALRYASAVDRQFSFRGQTVEVPGVATTLQNILGQQTQIQLSDKSISSFSSSSGSDRLSKGMMGSGDRSLRGLLGSKRDDRTIKQLKKEEGKPEKAKFAATIDSNPQNNTIIVHDKIERMPMYEKLIASLDQPIDQIEIEVSIVEINTNRLDDMGVDWQTRGKNGVFGFGDFSKEANTARNGFSHIFTNDINEQQGSGNNENSSNSNSSGLGNLSAILEGGGDYFLGKIRLLSQSKEAQVLSQPSVITMNNLEAIIDNSTTFYVKLQGEDEVDLVPVSSGSVLRVTPRVIQEDGYRSILLNVNIEAGQGITDDTEQVDGLPIVTKSTINTQALVKEDHSLLVGGFFFDTRDSEDSKMPILGDIPGIKVLFSNQKKSRRKVARMFLISPKLVNQQENHDRSVPILDTLKEQQNFHAPNYQTPDFPIFD